MKTRADVCLVTATTQDFLPGTVALLGSFARHHPSFGGDVVVIEHGLEEAAKRLLYSAFDRVRFMSVAPELPRRVARLQAALPEVLVYNAPMFYTLEAFRLLGRYRKVLHCDSDMLFQAPVDELFDASAALVCCGDMEDLHGRVRDAETYEPIADRSAAPSGRVIERPFNCGFLLLDGQLAAERPYEKLLAMMAAEQWRGLSSLVSLGDQAILNRYFCGRQTLASWTYNYLVPHGAGIRAREGISARQAKLLHFKGPVKPWLPRTALHWALGAGEPGMAPAFKLWHRAYMDCLAGERQCHSTTVVPLNLPAALPHGGTVPRVYMARRRLHFGAEHDLADTIATNLFGIAPNNSGSTFLKAAMATSRRTWNVVREAKPLPLAHGAAEPLTPRHPETRTARVFKVLWAGEQRWVDVFTSRGFDWAATRKAWYFQAFSRHPEATVFYAKKPRLLLLVPQLARHFANAKFLFMVRDPYAVCEGISRVCRTVHGMDAYRALGLPAGRSVETAAARHIVNCLLWQRRNIDAFGGRGTFFTYETMCDEPARVEAQIRRLVPAIDDLKLNQRLAVRGYNEGLKNMNARQIERLTASQLADINVVFERQRDVIEHFGYALRDDGRWRRDAARGA